MDTAPAHDYLWPVKAKPLLTSPFCDRRNDHPHGGLDLSLYGKVGTTPIVSVDDGVLMRIRASRYGYGNAVYVRMADKMVAVYAHLDRFSDRLERVADGIRRTTGEQKLDYYYEPWEEQVPIARGEVIGYGGNTGTGSPHLHFEVRYDDLVNLNPLTNGFPVADHVDPTIHEIMLTPIDNFGRVNGTYDPMRFAANGPPGTPIPVRGRVGVSVRACDRKDGGDRCMTPYRIAVAVDGAPFFETRYEQWSYEDKNILHAQYESLRERGTRAFYRAYNPYPVEIPFFSQAEGGSFDKLETGMHSVHVTVEDAAGNATTAHFEIDVQPADDKSFRPWPKGTGGQVLFNEQTIAVDDGAFVLDTYEASLFEPVRVDITRVDGAPEGVCYRVDGPPVLMRQTYAMRFAYTVDDDAASRLAIYERSPAGRLTYAGRTWNPLDRTLQATVDHWGTFCLASDTDKPVIGTPRVVRRSIVVPLRDDGAGPVDHRSEIFVGKRRLVTTYNAARRELSAPIPSGLGGTRTVRVEAMDRVGNFATREAALTLP
ncbi:M23 family metallopeptidase [bacterium]|nr:M23 family metallopeptidase [bacterium]